MHIIHIIHIVVPQSPFGPVPPVRSPHGLQEGPGLTRTKVARGENKIELVRGGGKQPPQNGCLRRHFFRGAGLPLRLRVQPCLLYTSDAADE